MKTKEKIQSELVELHFELEQLQKDIFNGYSNSIIEVQEIKIKINTLEWVLNN
ncbi:hypothetical protein [Flavobacterium sp.]|jgi:hypothetical protein|uniref:hypothetical protein n=1 Tax=Flavobacterium sp. TaxID=239 RepID=UPI0037BF6D76